MKAIQILTALALVAAITVLPGCENKPADDIPRAVTNTEAPAEAPAEAPMETAPAEAPAEAAPAEAPAEAAPAPEAAAPAGEPVTFAIVPNDENVIGFTGYKVTGKQQGGWAEYDGSVTLATGAIESAAINITIEMQSLFSGSTMLTDTLLTESWFNAKEFPQASFTSSKVEKAGDAYNVSGDLTLRGVTKNITFPAQISVDGDTLSTQAKFAVNRSDWGIKDTGFAGDLVEDEVVIEFSVVANKA